jgi:hypothetical protein
MIAARETEVLFKASSNSPFAAIAFSRPAFRATDEAFGSKRAALASSRAASAAKSVFIENLSQLRE